MWGRLLIATHLIQSNVYLVQSRAGVRLWWCTFHQPQQNCESWAKSIFAEPNRYIFNFSSSHFVFQGHILSTSGVAFSRKYSCSTAPTTTTVIILLWCRQFIHNPTTVLTAAISLPLSVLCVCSQPLWPLSALGLLRLLGFFDMILKGALQVAEPQYQLASTCN